MAIDVYWGSGSQYSWRVLLALELKRLRYESHLLDLAQQDHQSPDMLKLNPRGRVPVIVDDGYVLYGSLAILCYLDRKYPQAPLFGQTPEEHGLIMRMIGDYRIFVEPSLQQVVAAVFLARLDSRKEQVQTALTVLTSEAQRLERRLTELDWLVGTQCSAADLMIFPGIKVLQRALARREADELETPFEPLESHFPHIAAWLRRMETLPGYERTYPPHWRAS